MTNPAAPSSEPRSPGAHSSDASSRRAVTALTLAGVRVLADVDGALVLPDSQTLVVSDLHFEKGSSYAATGQLLPPYDSRTTLRRLGALIAHYTPRQVIALGDSFHDLAAEARMDAHDRAALQALVGRVEDWVWIEGNHDPHPPAHLGGRVRHTLEMQGLRFRHEPLEGDHPGEIAGHLHPCAKVSGQGRSVRRRCFALGPDRLILPAFGAYTGGLNVCDAAFGVVFGQRPDVVILGRDKLYPVSARRLLPDRSQLRARL